MAAKQIEKIQLITQPLIDLLSIRYKLMISTADSK
jgi:hypothetical protein